MSGKETRIALLRHGPTDWNRAGRIQGRTDIPLDDQARVGLAALRLPADWQNAKLVSSPLRRAVETAELVALRAPEPVEALREMNWGDWEGMRGADLKRDLSSGYSDIEGWTMKFQPPNGERLVDLQARAVAWAEAQVQNTLAVCHIGVMRALLAYATGWSFEGACPFRVKRNRLFIIRRGADGWKMEPETPRLEAVN